VFDAEDLEPYLGDFPTRVIVAGHKAELPRRTRLSIGGTACAEQRFLCVFGSLSLTLALDEDAVIPAMTADRALKTRVVTALLADSHDRQSIERAFYRSNLRDVPE
jgi:hypothetical protein